MFYVTSVLVFFLTIKKYYKISWMSRHWNLYRMPKKLGVPFAGLSLFSAYTLNLKISTTKNPERKGYPSLIMYCDLLCNTYLHWFYIFPAFYRATFDIHIGGNFRVNFLNWKFFFSFQKINSSFCKLWCNITNPIHILCSDRQAAVKTLPVLGS